MCTLTLIYSDGSTFIVGGFSSTDDANAWVAKANLDVSVQTQIVLAPPPVALILG